MRRDRLVKVVTAAGAAFLMTVVGCASRLQTTGFLSTYSNLEQVNSFSMRYLPTDGRLAKYSKFIVEPVVMRFYDPETQDTVEKQDIQHLQQYMYEAVRKSLQGAKYELTNKRGADVARLRVAITNIKGSSPALGRLSGAGLGEASIEAELLDSINGDQVAALIESEQGGRFSYSKMSKWKDVEAVMDDWARRLVERLDEAHMKKKG